MAKEIYLGGDKYDKAFKPITYVTDRSANTSWVGSTHLVTGNDEPYKAYFGFYGAGITVTVDDNVDDIYHIMESVGKLYTLAGLAKPYWSQSKASVTKLGVLRHLYPGLKRLLAPRKVVLV